MEVLFLQLQNLPSLKLPMFLSCSTLLHSCGQDVAVHTSASQLQMSLWIEIGTKSIKFHQITDMYGDLAIKVTNNLQIIFWKEILIPRYIRKLAFEDFLLPRESRTSFYFQAH